MKVTKENNKIIMELTPEENKAIELMIKFRGSGGLRESLNAWLETRTATAKDSEMREVYIRFSSLSTEDKEKFLNSNG